VRRRELDGCPIAGALQMIGDKWTLMIVRDLAGGPRRTMELLNGLFPISSRTLVARLRDMEKDKLVTRKKLKGNPAPIEYGLTDRGRLLFPVVDALRQLGEWLDCTHCEDRKKRVGNFCEACPKNFAIPLVEPPPPPVRRRQQDDSIVLL
jgi:DNA-binding HxlR family transcriptional regulator